jgi:hypothetical protein
LPRDERGAGDAQTELEGGAISRAHAGISPSPSTVLKRFHKTAQCRYARFFFAQ